MAALGVSSAAPTMQQQHNNMAGYHNMENNMNNQMVSSMNNNRMSMNNRQMNSFDNIMSGKQRMSAGVNRQMYSNNMMNNNMMMQQAGMKHGNNMMSNDRHMNNQMPSNMRDMHNRNSMSMYSNNMNNRHQNNMNNMNSNNMKKQMTMKQTFVVEDRPAFYKQDDFGNFAYGYNSGNSEQFVMGNPEKGVKGHYTYVDGNGLNRRVEYVADNEGFRIIKDSDRSGMRFRREAEPAMRMTSVMDSSLMRNNDHQMQRSALMPSMSMYRNMMASDRHNMNNQMSHPMNINMNNMLDGRHQQSMNNRNIMMQED